MKKLKNMSSKLSNNNLSDNNPYILYNVSNYKSTIDNTVTEILTKFVEVMLEYMRLISDKIIVKNKNYYCFIFERGLETIIHVFSIIFYFTKNLDLAFYHTQKAHYFYIEFIEQMSDDNVTFLQLSSRNAILFVYKKTIFDINNEYKKQITEPTNDEKIILNAIDTYIQLYKHIALFILKHNDFNYENKKEYINKTCDSIEFISRTINKHKLKQQHIDCVYLFITSIGINVCIFDLFKLLEDFIKKIANKKNIDKKIQDKLQYNELYEFISNNKIENIVDWL